VKSEESMNKPVAAIINLLVLSGTIYFNYYSNTGGINGQSVGSLSNEYANFFTPASYAFSIWGVIYLSLLANAVYLFICKNDKDVITQSKWLSLANIGNCIWIYTWLMEYTGLSVLTMILILFFLTKNALDLKIGQAKKPFGTWWPSSIYFGWIVVALAANVSAYLAKLNWELIFAQDVWAAVVIIIALGIYLFLSRSRNITYAAYVGVWALVAIMVKQWDNNIIVQYTAMASAAILLSSTVLKDFQLRRKGLY
jgi:hypothetical protein